MLALSLATSEEALSNLSYAVKTSALPAVINSLYSPRELLPLSNITGSSSSSQQSRAPRKRKFMHEAKLPRARVMDGWKWKMHFFGLNSELDTLT